MTIKVFKLLRGFLIERQFETGNMQYFSDSETYEEEDYIIPYTSEKVEIWDNIVASPHQWQAGDHSSLALAHQMKHLAVSVPSQLNGIKENVCIGPASGGKGKQKLKEQVPVLVPVGRWIKHYSSCHRILLVGEGDFSFSTCLAAAFGWAWASNMIATSLDSEAFLLQNYSEASSNIAQLSISKCKIMHEIDATKMANHPFLGGIKFDRIIFNFPYAGLFKEMSRDSQLRLHISLVSQFLENAKEMISENGEIHITHKTNGFHKEWKLEWVASLHGLRLVEAVDFSLVEYPGYNTKYGFGGDNNFNCHPSKTYKFRRLY